jgi:hypothetical protein
MWWLLVALFACSLAGCVDAGHRPIDATMQPGPSTGPAGDGTYWLVTATGQQQGDSGRDCDRSFFFRVDEASREVRLDPARYPIDPARVWSLVAYDVDDGSCPVAYALHANADTPEVQAGSLGRLLIMVDQESGLANVFIDGQEPYEVLPGQTLHLERSGTYEDQFGPVSGHADVLVKNHGAWPRDGLVVAEHGPGW